MGLDGTKLAVSLGMAPGRARAIALGRGKSPAGGQNVHTVLAYVRDQLGRHSVSLTVGVHGHLIPRANRQPSTTSTIQHQRPSATPAQPARLTGPVGR
jgi:hypothetical protein